MHIAAALRIYVDIFRCINFIYCSQPSAGDHHAMSVSMSLRHNRPAQLWSLQIYRI